MDTECVLVSDFGKVCRICMKFPETFLPITSFKIIEMITSCSSVQIWENDELPNQICDACFLQLQNTMNFKQLCEKSDTTFRQIIEQSKVKIENDDEDDVKTEENENFNFDSVSNGGGDDSLNLDDIKSDNDVKSEENHVSDDNDEDGDENESEEKMYTCEKCDKEFKKLWVLNKHMHRTHRVKCIKCSKCSAKSYHPLYLSMHEATHNSLVCNICKKTFANIYKLKRHKYTHEDRRSQQCFRCDKSFQDKWALKQHVNEMHAHEVKYTSCHVCGKSIIKKNLTIHMATHRERDKIACEICLKTFFHRQSLENHVKRVHDGIVPECNFLCNVCGRGVRSQAELSRHLLIHTKERPFACDKCDKTYRRSEALKMHISRVHLDERNFVCTFCSQAFYDKKILRNHVRRHTGEKPHKCHVCDKAFIQRVALKIHMKVHANSI